MMQERFFDSLPLANIFGQLLVGLQKSQSFGYGEERFGHVTNCLPSLSTS
jgi:hypothetical protein